MPISLDIGTLTQMPSHVAVHGVALDDVERP